MPKNNELLLLVDAHALLHRAYHALPPTMSTQDGIPTNSLYGFTLTTLIALEKFKPTHVAVCFDEKEPTLRKQAYPEYKANRPAAADDLAIQLSKAQEIPKSMGLYTISGDGHEADDYLGTLAEIAKNQGMKVVILTGDKDTFQLVDDKVSVCTLRTGMKDTVLMNPDKIQIKMGLRPDQVVDFKGLRGDPSDNIPGVPGVGDKTATKLLQKHQTLDGIYEHLDDDPDIKGKMLEKLRDNKEQAYLSRELATIKRDIPIDIDLAELELKLDESGTNEVFSRFEFRSLLSRTKDFFNDNPTDAPSQDRPVKESQNKSSIASAQPSLFGPAESTGAVSKSKSDSLDFQVNIINDELDLQKLIKELNSVELFAIDTETNSLDSLNEPPCGISISTNKNSGYYINLGHADAKLSPKVLQEQLGPVLENPKKTKVAHNLKFDMQVLENIGLNIVNGEDTLLMAYLLAPGARGLGLDALVLQEFSYQMQPIVELIGKGKSQIPFSDIPLGVAANYSVEDAVMTLRLRNNLIDRLRKIGQEEFLHRFELPLIPILSQMERLGVEIDTRFLDKLAKKIQKKLGNLEELIHDHAKDQFNINSPKQLSEILFNKLDIPTKGIKKTPQGELSTAASELEKIDHPIAKLLLEYRELEKLRSTYVEAIPELADKQSRVHTSYNQAVTATGRLSSSDPNLQNIPARSEFGRQIRNAFVAPNDHVLLAADYSQVELRVLAHLCGDPSLTKVYRDGKDIHAQTGAFLYNVKPEDVTKEQRFNAKTVNFGILYGMGARRLARENSLTTKEAAEFIENYFKSYPNVSTWMEKTLSKAGNTGYVETFFGRRRYMPELSTAFGQFLAQAERMALNHPIQGTAADLMKLAMINVSKRLAGRSEARMILQVHDEMVLEVAKDSVLEIATIVREEMENVAELNVPLVADISIGRSWGELEKLAD